MNIDDRINEYKEQIIDDLSKIVAYKSIVNNSEFNAPFGKENAKCLNEALRMAKEYGFETQNLDNYCGYVQIGQGDKLIGIAVHLDVVPVGKEWETDPFYLTLKDGKIYGRGVSDDKGAFIASLYALKIIKDMNVKLNKKIRLIMGCAEETGSECMKYYVKKEGYFDVGFTPDAEFPCINGEKGRISAKFNFLNSSIKDIQGGTVENAVCDNCIIKIKEGEYDREKIEKYFNEEKIQFKIEKENGVDFIEVKGIAAHASKPNLGKNAIMYLMMGLKEAGYKDDFVDFYCEKFNFSNDGEGLNIKCSDEYGELTCVNGKIYKNDEKIVGTIDIRVPVTIESNIIVDKLKNIQDEKVNIEVEKYNNSIYFPIDSPLVQKLLKVYQEVTGDKENLPITIGGGTYAKTLKNCIAFGCAFPGKNNKIHEANEFVDINDLLLQIKIYVYAILELLKD